VRRSDVRAVDGELCACPVDLAVEGADGHLLAALQGEIKGHEAF